MGSEFLVMSLEVLLATYNGEKFLLEQLMSIQNQTLCPERLLVYDDSSTDQTLEVLERFSASSPLPVTMLSADGRLGCIKAFSRLLQESTAAYVALADQDDRWDIDKLERTYALLRQLEQRHGADTPILVHSDLRLITASGDAMADSFLRRQRLDPSRISMNDLVFTNVVTGCTVMVNRALLDQALPIPVESMMHDWWLALVASRFGVIGFLESATLDYRQHAGNLLGSSGLGWRYWKRRLMLVFSSSGLGGTLRATIMQALAFRERYGELPSPSITLFKLPRHQRIGALLRLRAWPHKHGALRNLAFYILLLFMPRLKISDC